MISLFCIKMQLMNRQQRTRLDELPYILQLREQLFLKKKIQHGHNNEILYGKGYHDSLISSYDPNLYGYCIPAIQVLVL